MKDTNQITTQTESANFLPTITQMAICVAPESSIHSGNQHNMHGGKPISHTVIGLPEKLFFGTGIPAVILIFKKDKSDENVLLIDASREFKSGRNQNVLTSESIRKVIDTNRARESLDKYAYLATMEEIQENDSNLHIPRYVDTLEEEEVIDLMAVRKERLALQKELDGLEVEMVGYLAGLGYGS